MPPEIQDNIGVIAIALALAWAAWQWKKKQTKGPATQQGAAPVIIQQSAPHRKLLELHEEYDDDRAKEIRRQLIQKRLDAQTLERAALEKIGEILTPPKTDPKP